MSVTEIQVSLQFDIADMIVGRLVILDHQIYFEYDAVFLKSHLDISPFALPLTPGLKITHRTLFEGLPSVFDDSLPDGWGRLLLDRFMRSRGVLPNQLTPLDRLAHVGFNGMGALVYRPNFDENNIMEQTLDELALHAQHILIGSPDEVLPALLALNGSSAGARPKVMVSVDTKKKNIVCGIAPKLQQWLVKFMNTQDGVDAGSIEYVYSLMAKNAGVEMMETYLFPSKNNVGFFGTKRFDRKAGKRFHTHTAAGLLQADFRTTTLDYRDLFTLTEELTKDRRDVEKLFRQAVFNVLAHNRDDHLKNFSFLMNAQGEWHLSPAYDLTFSSGPGGEQTTTVLGKGKNISIENLIDLGLQAKLSRQVITDIIAQTRNALNEWLTLAKKYGVTAENTQLIKQRIHLRD